MFHVNRGKTFCMSPNGSSMGKNRYRVKINKLLIIICNISLNNKIQILNNRESFICSGWCRVYALQIILKSVDATPHT